MSQADRDALQAEGFLTPSNELTPLGTLSANLAESGLDAKTKLEAVQDFESGFLNPDLSFTETGELHYMDKETAVHRGRDTFRAWYLQGGWDRHKDSQPDTPFLKAVGQAVSALATQTVPQAAEGFALEAVSSGKLVELSDWLSEQPWGVLVPGRIGTEALIKRAKKKAGIPRIGPSAKELQQAADALAGASQGMVVREMGRNLAIMNLGNNLVWAKGYTATTGNNEPEISAIYDFERGMAEFDQTSSADAMAALSALSQVVQPDDEKAEMEMLEKAQMAREGVELAREEVGDEEALARADRARASQGELTDASTLAGGLGSLAYRKIATAGGRAIGKRLTRLNAEIVEKKALRQTAENALKADNAGMILNRKAGVDRKVIRRQIDELTKEIDELTAAADKVVASATKKPGVMNTPIGDLLGVPRFRDGVRTLGNQTLTKVAGTGVGTRVGAIGQKIDNYFTAPRGLPGHARNLALAGTVGGGAVFVDSALEKAGVTGGLGGTARLVSQGIALAALAPNIYRAGRTLARTTHAMGASYVARRSTVPYWRKVSQRMADNKLVSGAALTMDVFAKPLVPVVAMGKAAGRSMRAELPFNFIASGGQEGWLAETVAESLVFGFPGQVQGLIHGMGGMPAVMQKAEFDQLAANDAAELRRYLPARHQQAFDTLNPSVRRIVGVYSAMFPDLEFRFQPAPGNTTGSGYDRYTDTVYIDPNSRRPFDALIAHEVAHGVQERGFDKLIIDKLVGQDGLLRNEDGSLTSDALKFKAEYESLAGRQIDDETLAREWFAESSVPGLMQTQQLQRLVRRNPITRSLAESLLPKIPFGKRILQRSGILLDQSGNPVKGQGSMQALTQASPGVARIIDRYLRAVAGESRPSDTRAAVEKAKARPLTKEERENADRRNQIDFEQEADGSQTKVNGRRVLVNNKTRRQRGAKLGQEIEKLAEEISFADPDRMPEKMSLIDKINLFNEEEWTKLIDRLEKAGIYNPSQLALFREVFKRKAIGNSESLLFDYQPAIKTKGASKRYASREAELITGAIYEIKVTKDKNVILNIIDMDFLEQRAMKAATSKLGQELYPGGAAAIMRDVMILAENHVNGVPNATVFTKPNQLDFLNGILGNLSKEHRAKNPLAKGRPAVRSLRLDRINQAEGTQQKGLPFIPDKWRDNLLPEPQDAITPQTDAARQDRVDRLPEEDSGFGAQEGELPVGGRRGVGGDQGWVPAPDSPYPPASSPPLDGLPQTVKVNGKPVVFGPFQPARQAAEDYMAGAGLEYIPPTTYAKVDRQRATRIASAYERMPHAPNDPEVRESYRAMIDETLAQYEALKATGLVVEPNPPNTDPYGNPRNAILDVVENNHMWFFPTNEGFGGDAVSDVDVAENPLLEETGEVINGYRMTANDVFRVVHDYFGHIKEGNGFRAGGEENAWRAHSAMYSPKARRAMTSETRGQNSWVNYGPHGEFNRTASGADTEYAAQKTGLLPEWVSEEGAGDDIRRMPEPIGFQPSLQAPSGVKTEATNTTLPNFSPRKIKSSLAKNVLTANLESFESRLDRAGEKVAADPARLADPKGYVEYMRDTGVWGPVLTPPTTIGLIADNPAGYVDYITTAHQELGVEGGMQAAQEGLDSTVRMREAIGNKPDPWIAALHHLWGILSRQLPPVQQEALWLRLMTSDEVLAAIQSSIDGNFTGSDFHARWAQKTGANQRQSIVGAAIADTADGSEKLGNQGTANANAYEMMLNRWDGKWDQVSDVYSADKSAIEMGRAFWGLGQGPVGIKNKVQRFIGLTYGTPGVILDRWQYVHLWLPSLIAQSGKASPREYFSYGQKVPRDPASLYGDYGTIESAAPSMSLALYEGIETALSTLISQSPDLQQFLGRHANVGGFHWNTWNLIKNEAVGHSSLNLTYDLANATVGRRATAQDVSNLVKNGSYFTEGKETNTSTARFTLDRGRPVVTRSGGLPDGQ